MWLGRDISVPFAQSSLLQSILARSAHHATALLAPVLAECTQHRSLRPCARAIDICLVLCLEFWSDCRSFWHWYAPDYRDTLNCKSLRHEINAAFEALARERPAALFVGPDPFFTNRRVQLANLAARHASVARPSRSRCADELWDQLNRSGFAGGSNS